MPYQNKLPHSKLRGIPTGKFVLNRFSSSKQASRHSTSENKIKMQKSKIKMRGKREIEVKFPKELEGLLEKGGQHGFVTFQEILQTMEAPESKIPLLDALYDEFF